MRARKHTNCNWVIIDSVHGMRMKRKLFKFDDVETKQQERKDDNELRNSISR